MHKNSSTLPLQLPMSPNSVKLPMPGKDEQTSSTAKSDLKAVHSQSTVTSIGSASKNQSETHTKKESSPGDEPVRRAIERQRTRRKEHRKSQVNQTTISGTGADDPQRKGLRSDGGNSASTASNAADEESVTITEEEDKSVIVSSASSDQEDSDDELGSPHKPRISPRTREALEDLIYADKTNTTMYWKKKLDKKKKQEDAEVKNNRTVKYLRDIGAGGINQMTSFGIAGATATALQRPWLFAPLAAFLSEIVGDRLAQVARKSTIIPNVTKENAENQRRLARLAGDFIESCAGKDPKKKFIVTVGKQADGTPITKKVNAAEALRLYGRLNGLSTWAMNFLVRGFPFICFWLIYSSRDFWMNAHCYSNFYQNPYSLNSTQSGCPDPSTVDVNAIRWATTILTGFCAGASTSFLNQLIASTFPGKEITNYSPDVWKLQIKYLENARIDNKNYLDELARNALQGQPDDQETSEKDVLHLKKAVRTLDKIQERELAAARFRASRITAYVAELQQATQAHRAETDITPEVSGKRLETFFSFMGKMISLFAFCHVIDSMDFRKAHNDSERLHLVLLAPFALIVWGWAFKDTLAAGVQGTYGTLKGCFRACSGHAEPAENDDQTTNGQNVTAIDDDADDGNGEFFEAQSDEASQQKPRRKTGHNSDDDSSDEETNRKTRRQQDDSEIV